MSQMLHVLWHEHRLQQDFVDMKRIGVYRSAEKAEDARARAGRLPGFVDHPGGFRIEAQTVGQLAWGDGFAASGRIESRVWRLDQATSSYSDVIYIVEHEYESPPDVDHARLIGMCATSVDAEAAIEVLKTKPGFQRYAEGFSSGLYHLDEDHWLEGFVTVTGWE